MRTSFSTLACPEWSLACAIEAAERHGYDGVEIRVINGSVDLLSQAELSGDGLRESAARLKDAEIEVPCIGTGACLHWPSALRRQQDIEVVLRHIEMAQSLQAPFLRVFGDRIQDGATRRDTERWITDALNELRSHMQGSGVDVLLETHGDFSSGSQLEFLGEECGLIWDPANTFADMGGQPVISSSIRTQIRHVHVKDLVRCTNRTYAFKLPGDGEFPLQLMLGELRRIRYDGFVSFEWERHWHPELAPPETALPVFTEWWRREVPL